MPLNRRAFLARFSVAAVGACVAVKVPTAWLPAPVQRWAACEFLREHYMAFVAAHGGGMRAIPRAMYVGRELLEAYEVEILPNMRFVSTGFTVMFKGAKLYERGRGWTVECEA